MFYEKFALAWVDPNLPDGTFVNGWENCGFCNTFPSTPQETFEVPTESGYIHQAKVMMHHRACCPSCLKKLMEKSKTLAELDEALGRTKEDTKPDSRDCYVVSGTPPPNPNGSRWEGASKLCWSESEAKEFMIPKRGWTWSVIHINVLKRIQSYVEWEPWVYDPVELGLKQAVAKGDVAAKDAYHDWLEEHGYTDEAKALMEKKQ